MGLRTGAIGARSAYLRKRSAPVARPAVETPAARGRRWAFR
ncbi:hypothetical protein GZL_01713 [Streptomyces sp. 769]|nr:hypothetical protein GZL_01713 [Streptomyces sp. 769]